jgi:DeoR/GlpR family transcriptional regulator of sugar metabolism
MFIEERHQKILQFLKDKGRVEVQDLSSIFQVSDDSIRRDLRIMEQKGLLSRTYGGAVLPNQSNYCPPFTERIRNNKENKERIAYLASLYLKDNDSIFLDGSTTVLNMIPYLNNYKNITVVTNSILIAYEIASTSVAVNLIVLGGIVDKNDGNALGTDTVKAIERLNLDKIFAAPCAISERGLSCSAMEEAPIKKAMIEAGREIYLLIESEKFGSQSLINFAPIDLNYTIITDPDFSKCNIPEFNNLISKGLKIIYKE